MQAAWQLYFNRTLGLLPLLLRWLACVFGATVDTTHLVEVRETFETLLYVCYDSSIMALAITLGFSIIPILIALYALRVSLRTEKYARAQVKLMQEQEEKREREQASQDQWSAKFDAAVSAVQKLGPAWIQTKQGQTNAYGLAFPGPDLVPRIERYLIEDKLSRGPVRARQMDVAQLRLPLVQETVTQVLDCVEKFKQDWPDEAKRLNL